MSRFEAHHVSGLRVGFLAGSFNPVHHGHLFIANAALRALKLDFVYLLVSPRNPFKKDKVQLTLAERVARCEAITRNHYRIKVLDIEKFNKTYESYYTVRKLRDIFVGSQLFWLIGSDNMQHIHTWRGHEDIFSLATVAVFRRNSVSASWLAIHSSASAFFKLADKFIAVNDVPLRPEASSNIREKLGPFWLQILRGEA